MVYQNKFISQIGLFELNDKSSYTDDEGDIDIDLLNKPLIYKFTTKDYLLKYKKDDITDDNPDQVDNPEQDYHHDDEDQENWINDFLGEKMMT